MVEEIESFPTHGRRKIIVNSRVPSTAFDSRGVELKLGAGTAFESVVAHYERAELPHTLPCHKIYTI